MICVAAPASTEHEHDQETLLRDSACGVRYSRPHIPPALAGTDRGLDWSLIGAGVRAGTGNPGRSLA